MALGHFRELNLVSQGDTAELYAYLHDREENLITSDALMAVHFTIQAPDGTRTDNIAGEIQDDGAGFLRYIETNQLGEYRVIATFTLDTGERRSVHTDFEIIDPFNPPELTGDELIAAHVWHLLEDCFDSEEGGPWLRDMTLRYFSPKKIQQFIDEGLFELNVQSPQTEATRAEFLVADAAGNYTDLPILAQGTLVAVIRHLMRSYVEQPAPQGGQIVFEDRRDYLQRWGTIYQIEEQTFRRWAALWKRKYLGLGKSKLLVSSKAGRLIPAPMRTRFIGRGYW